MPTPNIQKIRCADCKKFFGMAEVNKKNWKCPNCNEPLSLKVEISEYFHSCFLLKPGQIRKGFSVSLDSRNIHQVLNVSQIGDNYRIALKEYGVTNHASKKFLLVIDGAWID